MKFAVVLASEERFIGVSYDKNLGAEGFKS